MALFIQDDFLPSASATGDEDEAPITGGPPIGGNEEKNWKKKNASSGRCIYIYVTKYKIFEKSYNR